ncbi:unnamed protein product [Prunus brigantina]
MFFGHCTKRSAAQWRVVIGENLSLVPAWIRRCLRKSRRGNDGTDFGKRVPECYFATGPALWRWEAS